MASWSDVADLVSVLPDAVAGHAHEGSPTYDAGRHHFARLRHEEDGGELVQTWTGDLGFSAVASARPDVFVVVQRFRFRVSTWARLDRLDRRELAELLLDSYAVRSGSRRAAAVDQAAYLGRA